MTHNKIWKYREKVPSDMLHAYNHLPPLIVQLLYTRGVLIDDKIDAFLDPDYVLHTNDPFLFRDMEKAVERIQRAIANKERIVAHGDYDADGVCGSAVLVDGLTQLGANVKPYIPHREREGYGMNKDTVRMLAKEGTRLIITADCGISNKPEIDLAAELGIDVIVTDHHHEPLAMPDKAYAIINPNVSGESYPFKGLAGVGVAFKLIQALFQRDDGKHIQKGAEKWLLDLVAISTITDMMPLLDENRTLVKYGILVLRKTKRKGLHAFSRALNVPIEQFNSYTIGFQIGPRLNAAGRLQHADIAYQTMMAKTDAEADALVQRLEQINNDRRAITDVISAEVDRALGEVHASEKVLFAHGKDWPIGVVGLVAGKIAQKYNRPVFILGESDGNIVASGRSVPSLNIVEVLQASEKYYLKYGGHAAACGFTLKHAEDLDEWKSFMKTLVAEKLTHADNTPHISIDAKVKLRDIHWDLWSYLEKLEPFGQANPQPVYAAEKALVKEVRAIGKNGKHLRLIVEQEGAVRQGIGFGLGKYASEIRFGDAVDVAFDIHVNEWNGSRELQLKISEIRKNG